MKILAIDTSSKVASAAVLDGEKLVCEFSLNHKKTHSQKLMPIIEEVLKSAEISLSDVDYIATTTGPGSFTGIRIGVATAKGLAHAAGKPLIGVSTLEALAYNIAGWDSLICPVMDARRSQVYTAVYSMKNGRAKQVISACAMGIDTLTDKLLEINLPVIFLGDGVSVHRDYIKEKMGELCSFALANLNMQRAGSVAVLAKAMAEEGKVGDYISVVPDYYRKSQAEREYDEKHK